MKASDVQIEASWKEVLKKEFTEPYFLAIKKALQDEHVKGNRTYPPGPLIFKAFELTPLHEVKVVILGQDPYHNPGEAMGLSFSVPKGVRIPPSLRNIYKELHADCQIDIPSHGDLTSWAEQGVFLLNAMLTVRERSAGSHQSIGWTHFTDAVIKALSDHKEGIVFLLWGRFAQSKISLIDQLKHHVLTAAHPSPLARTGFIGCKHFSKTNTLLTSMGRSPVNWSIS